MNAYRISLLLMLAMGMLISVGTCSPGASELVQGHDGAAPIAAEKMGQLADHRLVECSGLETSTIADDLLWAINDGGHGPYLYAMGYDGRHRGRVIINGARNQDWEGLDTFEWEGRPMILIADFGDNDRRRDIYRIYLVEEPRLSADRVEETLSVDIAQTIDFTYPDGRYDAEGVTVDTRQARILILTKRDLPPIVFELPLKPNILGHPVVARRLATIETIPAPTAEDLNHRYGKYRSQPTALDLSADGRSCAVLTYKHAYLFSRSLQKDWAGVFSMHPIQISLPLPQDHLDLKQREAVCFSRDGGALWVTSEGRRASIYKISIQ